MDGHEGTNQFLGHETFPVSSVHVIELERRDAVNLDRCLVRDELPTLRLETKTGLTASSSIRAVLGVIHVTGEK